jgi:tetrahedral aminopeptidase
MEKSSLKFLTDLLETPSPSGFESQIQRVIKKYVSRFADEVSVDVHGNLRAVYNPTGSIRVMLAGHCDQIGMMVTHIDDAGYIYFGAIGGIDPAVLPGTRLRILTRGEEIDGIIGHKPVHLVSAEDRGKKVELKKLWIDIGAASGREAKQKVSVGDPIVYYPGVMRLGPNFLTSPGCDDRVGVFVVMEALRLVSEKVKNKKTFPVALFGVSTVQEEIGLRGARTSAFDIDPHVGIAVDVTHASDNPAADAKEIGTIKLGEGPAISRGPNINQVLEGLLVSAAQKHKIKYQPLSAPSATGTDANAIQVSRAGVAAALIGLPNRYMHSQVEVVDLRDLENSAKLLAHTILDMKVKTSFIPV